VNFWNKGSFLLLFETATREVHGRRVLDGFLMTFGSTKRCTNSIKKTQTEKRKNVINKWCDEKYRVQ